MHPFAVLLKEHESWLMRRVRDYALERDYTRYTSTLEEAWRVSITGLTDSITAALAISDEPWELGPDDDFVNDPLAAFGVLEAQRHRSRGVTLAMFLGLMKYYRQAYLDLVKKSFPSPGEDGSGEDGERFARFVDRVFDRIEIAFCTEWSRSETVTSAIDELQAATRLMTNEKNRFLTIFESLPTAVFVLDDTGRIIHMNQAGARMIAPSPTSGGHYYSHPEDQIPFPWLADELSGFRKIGGEEKYEYRLMQADGNERTVMVRFRVMQDISFKYPGTIVIIEDVTDLKRTEEELKKARDAAEEANRAKSVFLANMSHELRTPLNAILGFSNLMRDEDGLSEEQRKTLDIINKSGEHLLKLINDVLDMAKIEAGRAVVEDSDFDLGEMVRDVYDLMNMRAKAKGLSLETDQSSRFPRYIRADLVKLRQILINLIGNAVKFTPHGAVILRLDARPAEVPEQLLLLIEVEDNGAGIAREDQKRIFEPFVQVGTPATQKGSGLGLTITRQFVDLVGGRIGVESAPGSGSKFRVEVPVGRVEEAGNPAVEGIRGRVVGLAADQPEFRVLIVEDETKNWRLLRRLLEQVGFPVRVAENGAEGVRMFESWQPHFILMDIRMPIMDGLEATRRIRELAGGKDVKIAACTAFAFSEERDQCLSAGMDDFVRKPYRADEVFDCMARNLGVRFIHEETPGSTLTAPPETLQPESMTHLPAELRMELFDALIKLDSPRIIEIVRRVSETHPDVGRVLSQHADQLGYTEILRALQACEDMMDRETP